ncbi:alpha-ketoacid dehydrogenase subunit alpha/beta [Sphingobacterium zeae]|uniref:3-methyl-2-oxobutanoate dehydrogenase (2-methylpropanoyl-transferring) n=1 Tax=Sphingobacterium zeae TaxID=1776859 RepID=A0ABU0U3E8_9SPHI|nr:alpha-ketoacid dehydrogenase subunit alpha/beta [Sphingobacterium zeae]MDQ1149364.1 pyruvate/2-oxoglutarate/acetoin dehydrogenase E1 component/TPP-dependent pyruvate/acetoin dehydrogenase alpha subunit [Sphingobacterium zeae]
MFDTAFDQNNESISTLSFDEFKKIIVNDYRTALESRYVSLLGRKEVLTGKAKFGIFGDGKELAQIAMAKVFRNGDWRSGYYRDQTFIFASGISDVYHFFSQLYAHPDVEADPSSAGRQMNCHFSTRVVDDQGNWLNQMAQKNSFSDISTTGGQMARLLGLGLASKLYKQNRNLDYLSYFSNKGNEVAFCSIGNAATSEGVFFEVINAVGVHQIPTVISIWDDGYGISVPNEIQTTKGDISEVLRGFQKEELTNGIEIFKVRGWDYAGLCETYEKAAHIAREKHIPCLIHVTELTQPQGHSSSGSHERYKSKERLQWEADFDCIAKMKDWIISSGIATLEELEQLDQQAKDHVRQEQKRAWTDYIKTLSVEAKEAIDLLQGIPNERADFASKKLQSMVEPSLKEVYGQVRKVLHELKGQHSEERQQLLSWYKEKQAVNEKRYNSKLFTAGVDSPAHVKIVPALYSEEAKVVDGREVLNLCFEENFRRDERLLAFGEDVGKIGDVNQGFAGLQEKLGVHRVFDTGIRENSIIGKGLGLAIRGFRPIAEIQYLDYLIYGITVASDDLSTLSYRTFAGQKAPVIIRTRGHRLEGIWHSGSPMSVILGALRGLHVCVPRNMTQAAGMYNTLFRSDEPAIVVECLNGYRLKERLPENVGEFTVPIGYAECVKEGSDITVVSYGSTLRVVEEAAMELERLGIFIEIIDAQTLQPFDKGKLCAESLKKTNKLLIVDEDVPGGASAFILQEVLEKQNGYYLLDSQPRTLTAKAHRPPYGSDGDYFSKPSSDDVVETVYAIMHEANPEKYPSMF